MRAGLVIGCPFEMVPDGSTKPITDTICFWRTVVLQFRERLGFWYGKIDGKQVFCRVLHSMGVEKSGGGE
jgi:hypothetical protein